MWWFWEILRKMWWLCGGFVVVINLVCSCYVIFRLQKNIIYVLFIFFMKKMKILGKNGKK